MINFQLNRLSNMIYLIQLMQDIAAVENNFFFQANFVVKNVLMFNQYDYHIYISKKFIKIIILIFSDFMFFNGEDVRDGGPELQASEELVIHDSHQHFLCRQGHRDQPYGCR